MNIRMLAVHRLTFQYIVRALRSESVLAKLLICSNKLILNLRTFSDIYIYLKS